MACFTKSYTILKLLQLFCLTVLLITSLVILDIFLGFQERLKSVVETSRPVIVWYTDVYVLPTLLSLQTISCSNNKVECDVIKSSKFNKPAAAYLFYGSSIQNFPLPRGPRTIWGLFHEETPNNMAALWDEAILNWFNFSFTFSRYSDVPMPLVFLRSLDELTSKRYFISTSIKNTLYSKIAPVLYLQSDCYTSTQRDAYVGKLKEYIPVDSYGSCVNNKQFPKSLAHLGPSADYKNYLFSRELYTFISKYKFVIAIENAVCNDYITEKFWRAIHLGVVPIYFGSPLIRDWLPNNRSAILLEEYPTPELLSKHLYELLQNDRKYEEYLEHKTKGLISNRRIYEEIKKRPNQNNISVGITKLYCIMCERIHEFNTNSSRVNIVTKKHYDCPLPTSAITLSFNSDNPFLERYAAYRRYFVQTLNASRSGDLE